MRIVGISAFYHDSAAALVEDGRIAAAAQEERFTRKKFDAGFPRHAIGYCLDEARVRLRDADYVVFYDKPFLKFERLVETYLAFAPRGFASFVKAMPVWLGEKLFQKRMLVEELQQIDAEFDGEGLRFQVHEVHRCLAAGLTESAVMPLDETLQIASTLDAIRAPLGVTYPGE